MRRDKHNYYLDTAQTVLERSTCLKRREGAVIVKNDEIVSTGYNGAPRGRANCTTLGRCALSGAEANGYAENCRAVHAETNAIISAARNEMLNSVLYIVCVDPDGNLVADSSPCGLCKRFIINAGIRTVICRNTPEEYTIFDVQRDWIDSDETLKK